jgi:HK97 family phage major capsid protein
MGMRCPIATASYQYIKHVSTSGTPALVADGGAKPELTPTFDHVTVNAVKIAAWTSAGYESLMDFPAFSGYLQEDLIRHIILVENNELLVQTGTTGHIDGLIHQAGLSQARPSDATESSLDALEIAIAAMRERVRYSRPLRVVERLCGAGIRVVYHLSAAGPTG